MAGRMFVASEVGFWDDPKHITFAMEVGHPACGAGFILRLREFFLKAGTRGVLPKRYDARDIAAAVRFDGQPRKLIQALGPKGAGVLVRRRGRFVYTEWRETATGWWETRKAADRDRKRRGAGKDGEASADAPRNVGGASADAPRRNGDQAINQGAGGAGGPPAGPPPPGGGLVASRRAWIEEKYPLGVVDPAKLGRLIEAMDDLEWKRFEHATLNRYLNTHPKKLRPVEVVIGKRLYRLVKAPKVRAPAPASEAPKKAEPAAADLEAQRWFQRRADIKARLKGDGLKGEDLERRTDELLEAEKSGQGAEAAR